MLKKILYVIVVIAVIVVLAIMWTNSKKEVVENPVITEQQDSTSITDELDSINIDSGIDADLNSIDADLKTL